MIEALEFSYRTITTIIFALGIIFFLAVNGFINDRVDLIKDNQSSNALEVTSNYEYNTDVITFTKSELISMLLGELDSKVVVETASGVVVVDPLVWNPRLFDFNGQGFYDNYQKQYFFTVTGEIEYIMFKEL